MLVLAAMIVMGATIFFLGYKFLSGEVQASSRKRLGEEAKPASSLILKLCRPLFNLLVLPYSQNIKAENWRKKHKNIIVSAGLEDELDADELLAFKIFLGIVAPLLLIAYQWSTNGLWALWVYPGMMIVLYMYPSIWVKSRRKSRHDEIRLQMPFVIDLLTLSTEAGLDFIGALQKVVEKTRPGPLVQEIGRMLQQIQLGTSRADSLRTMGQRIDLNEISSLVAVLVTADQMGSPLGSVLRVQSDLIRTQRFTQAEKRGAAATQKLLFPLIFLIMPAVFIMIFGPVILGMFGIK